MGLYWTLLGGAIVTSLIGQTLLKAGAGGVTLLAQLLDWRTLAGLLLYGGAAFFYIFALRRIPLSVALPCTAISYVAAALIGHFVFGEALTPLRIGALALIFGGVVLLAAGG